MEPIGVLGEAQKNSPEESVSGEQPDGSRTQLTQGLQEDVVEDTAALCTGASQRWPQVGQGAAVQSVGITDDVRGRAAAADSLMCDAGITTCDQQGEEGWAAAGASITSAIASLQRLEGRLAQEAVALELSLIHI